MRGAMNISPRGSADSLTNRASVNIHRLKDSGLRPHLNEA